MPSSHHYSLSHPASAARRHVKHPLTPPLTPSSSINSTRPAPAPADLPLKDDHTRIVLLTNLVPTLDPSLLEHTIHQILSAPARIKGINTRPLPATRSAPVVFFDSRDASAVCHAVASGTSLLDPVCADGPVGAEMISVTQLVKDIGPSPFLDSIDASFHLRVHATKQINLPILQSLLASFGQLRTFAPESAPEIDLDTENALYLIEYFDSRDGHRAIHDLDGKVLFAMSLSVLPVSPDAVQFPSIASGEIPAPIGPPGSVSNLRVRFRSLGFEEPEPTLLYASESQLDQSAPPHPICLYCPNESPHYPPPPPHLLPPSYPPPDSGPGIVYYPSLSVPPAPTTGYEYLDPHYAMAAPSPAPAWGGYDMVPLPMGMVPMPMGMPMPPPPPHPYYEGAAANGGGRGYVVPYAHPPLYGHLPTLQNQRFIAGEGGTPSSGSSVGSSSGSAGRLVYQGTPPPLMAARLKANLKGSAREKGCLTERACSCSRSSPAPSTSLEDTNITPSTEPPVASGGTATTPPSERNQLNIKRIEEGLDTRTTVMIKNIPNKMSDRDLMVFIERVCPRRIDFFYLRMDFQNGCNVGYAFVNFIHVQDLLGFAKARLGVKWNMFSSEKVLQMSYANYQGKEALVEKFKNSAIMDEREAWRPRIFYSSGQNQGFPEPFPPPTHMRRKERSFFNRGALFVPAGGVGADGRRGMRVGGVLKDGTGALGSRNLSVAGLTFGKGWLGRGASDQEAEVVGGV